MKKKERIEGLERRVSDIESQTLTPLDVLLEMCHRILSAAALSTAQKEGP